MAVHAFHQFASTPAADEDSDDDTDEKEEIMSIATGLDGILCQLHKQMATLQTYKRVPEDDGAEVSLALQPKIENMYDACPYVHINRESVVLTQHCCKGLQSYDVNSCLQRVLSSYRSSCTGQVTPQGIGNIACTPCCRS